MHIQRSFALLKQLAYYQVSMYGKVLALSDDTSATLPVLHQIGIAIKQTLEGKFTAEEITQLMSIERFRKSLVKDKHSFTMIDYGAGANKSGGGTKQVSISDFAKHSSTSYFYGKLLFALIRYLRPNKILEMGTCLGISSLYIASAIQMNGTGKQICMEGDETLKDITTKHLLQFDILQDDFEMILGNFDDTLPSLLNKEKPIQLFFIDGNHKGEALLRYFNQCLEVTSKNAVFVLDDIRWSTDMQQAYAELKNHPSVLHTLDMWKWGILVIK